MGVERAYGDWWIATGACFRKSGPEPGWHVVIETPGAAETLAFGISEEHGPDGCAFAGCIKAFRDGKAAGTGYLRLTMSRGATLEAGGEIVTFDPDTKPGKHGGFVVEQVESHPTDKGDVRIVLSAWPESGIHVVSPGTTVKGGGHGGPGPIPK